MKDTVESQKKKEQLYLSEVALLDTLLQRNAITKAQYDKSLHDLTEKMGMEHLQK